MHIGECIMIVLNKVLINFMLKIRYLITSGSNMIIRNTRLLSLINTKITFREFLL